MHCDCPSKLLLRRVARPISPRLASGKVLARPNTSSLICSAHKIVVLPGDGIGPEIAMVAQKVLMSAGKACGEEFVFQEELIGGAAM